MTWLQLSLKGEIWAEYGLGLRFPRLFRRAYPMRGGGRVSKVLYWMNKCRLDGLLLKHVDSSSLKVSHTGFEDVAFFYPAASRSTTRYYGYRVKDGAAVSYLKFATTPAEASLIRREVANTRFAERIPNRSFGVPHCRDCREIGESGHCFAEFDLLPESAVTIQSSQEIDVKVEKVRRQIADAGFVHGDFAAQNIKVDSSGRLWVIDWEEASGELPSLCDEISYWTAMEHYGRGVPLSGVWESFKRRYLDRGDLKDDARAALQSMAERKIAMGRELLAMWR